MNYWFIPARIRALAYMKLGLVVEIASPSVSISSISNKATVMFCYFRQMKLIIK